MLRVIQAGVGRPISFPVDPEARFQPGRIGQLKMRGNEAVLGVSDGTAALGIIDDVKEGPGDKARFTVYETLNFTAPGQLLELQNNDVIQLIIDSESHAVSGGVSLYSGKNGVVKGPDSPCVVKLHYVCEKSATREDTTIVSGRCTIWTMPGVFQTDQYDASARFSVGAALYPSSDGRLTTLRTKNTNPVGICMNPPSAQKPILEFYFTGPTAVPATMFDIPDQKAAEDEPLSEQEVQEIDELVQSAEEAQEAIDDINAEFVKEAKQREVVAKANLFREAYDAGLTAQDNGAIAKSRVALEQFVDGFMSVKTGEIPQSKPTIAPIEASQPTSTTLADFAAPLLAAIAVGAILGPSATIKSQQRIEVKA